MPNSSAIQNNFIGGFKTEFTGLNFPENACTAVENFVFTITGDATRRGGFDFEQNYVVSPNNNFSVAFLEYKWNNAGGDGQTEFVVQQVGGTLNFFKSSAQVAGPPPAPGVSGGTSLSNTNIFQPVTIANFIVSGNNYDPTIECQFADGNGVLFVFQPQCDPFYVTYISGVIAATRIDIQTRDFVGIPEPGVADNFRPPLGGLTNEMLYNLYNQGWTTASWTGTSNTSVPINIGSITFALASQTNTTAVTGGAIIAIRGTCSNGSQVGGFYMSGNVTSYVSPFSTITINVTDFSTGLPGFTSFGSINLQLASNGNINTFQAATGNNPSNSDVWWTFINSTGVFSPSTTVANVPLDNSPAPKGHFILDEFNQQKGSVSGISTVQSIVTQARPSTGAFFADRIWYAGVNASQAPTGDAPFYTWTESIYFSQSINQQVQGAGSQQYGQCYQTNDPTSNLQFDLLPTDGGVIVIEGSGAIYKLFPVTNGLLAFAANGIWFITGGTALGFLANDYSVNKISNVRVISGSSFVNVLGYPIFWNEEGIWSVTPNQNAVPYGHGGLNTENLCIGTILTYYNSLPIASKVFAKGDFDPINFTIQWVFRSTPEAGIANRYQYDSALSLNTLNKAFYPYTLNSSGGNVLVNGIIYVSVPGSATSVNPVFKYPVSFFHLTTGLPSFTYAEERDFTNYVDFISWNGVGFNYTSNFTAGYSLHGGLISRWNPEYIYLYLRGSPNGYLINGIWDYASDPNSGRIPSPEYVLAYTPQYGMQIKRHRIRGRGYVFQLQISSIQGQPLDIMGWSVFEHKAAGP